MILAEVNGRIRGMTLKQFYAELEKCKNAFLWKLKNPNTIRATSTKWPQILFCPITALSSSIKDRPYCSLEVYPAAKLLGLTVEDANSIVVVSDGRRDHFLYDKVVRDRLEQTLLQN